MNLCELKTPNSNEGYLYHITNLDNFLDIRSDGKLDIFSPWHGTDQDVWPDGKTEKRAYFMDSTNNLWQFAPEGESVYIRVKKNDINAKRENTGDYYITKPVSTKHLEFYNTKKDCWEKF